MDPHVLKGVCEDIATELIQLIEGRSDLGHKVSYQKQWRRLNERVVNLISPLWWKGPYTKEASSSH
jgi:hypothetical protein